MNSTAKLCLLALAISLASCSKSNDDTASNNNNVNQVSGNWVVTYYYDSGKDETSDYSGYSFEFASDGSLTASHNTGTFDGTWMIGDNSSDDDRSSSKFVITITGNKRMDDIQDDWLIIKLTDSEIWLQDDNPQRAEELRFGK